MELVQTDVFRSWTVKDSYANLGLDDLGFEVVFDAEWIAISARDAALKKSAGSLTWQRMTSASDLSRWRTAWSEGGSTHTADEIFHDALLTHTDIAFVLAVDGDVVIGGAALNRGAGVVGLSNVFTSDESASAVWNGLVSEAAAIFPDQSLVGYERDTDLSTAKAVGFDTIGPLRVWSRESRTTTRGH